MTLVDLSHQLVITPIEETHFNNKLAKLAFGIDKCWKKLDWLLSSQEKMSLFRIALGHFTSHDSANCLVVSRTL